MAGRRRVKRPASKQKKYNRSQANMLRLSTGMDISLNWIEDPAIRGKIVALRRMGFLVRKIARNSLRRRKKISPPGQPPSVHAPGNSRASLKNIWALYEPDKDAMIIGVAKVSVKTSEVTPRALEFGGPSTILSRPKREPGEPRDTARLFQRQKIWVTIKRRSFMRRAFQIAKPEFGQILAESHSWEMARTAKKAAAYYKSYERRVKRGGRA